MKIKSFECPKSIKNHKKKLGKSDFWLMSCLFHQPREPAYHIVDCRISRNGKGGLAVD